MLQNRLLPFLLAFLAAILASPALPAQANEADLGYILRRYSEANGGRAAMERIISVRLRGKMVYPDGAENNLTVLKKKPDLVRMTVDTGTVRVVRAYNGDIAWYSREQGGRSVLRALEGSQALDLIRDAPLENVLLDNSRNRARLTLGPEREFASRLCHQVIATYPDGSRVHHFIDQQDYLERRIIQYDAGGSEIAQIIPSEFEKTDGVVFSMKIERWEDGQLRGTLMLEDIATNIGIIDGAFDPPSELAQD